MKAHAYASCVCLCLLLVSSTAPVASAGSGAAFDPSVYGFWAKTLGGGDMLDHIFEAKQKLQQELEVTRQTMLDLAEAQMLEMLEKIESGDMQLEDDVLEVAPMGSIAEAAAAATNATTSVDHRSLSQLGKQHQVSPLLTADLRPEAIFRGELAPLRQIFTAKPDFRRCTFFGGSEICLPAKKYFVRKSVGFACDLQLKKGSVGDFFACGRPGKPFTPTPHAPLHAMTYSEGATTILKRFLLSLIWPHFHPGPRSFSFFPAGISTALCLEWPIEIKFASFITPITVPICLPDARTVEAALRILGGDLTAAINLLL